MRAGREGRVRGWAFWALGRAERAGALQSERAHERGWQRRTGRAGGRDRRRQGRAGRPAGRPVRVWCAQLGQVGCFGAPDSVFGLV